MNATDVLNAAGGGQYVEANGIARMFADLESYIYPFFLKSQPLLYALAKINFIVVPLIFFIFLAYVIFYRKHRLLNKLEKKNNYYIWGGSLILYIILGFMKINFGYDIVFDLSTFVLPTIAKFYGPLVGCIFAVLQYILNILVKGGNFNFLLLIVAATSGVLYGILFYRRKTRFTTCISTKIIVGFVCNVFLTAIIFWQSSNVNIAQQMTGGAISTVLTSPVHAIIIYAIFKTVRLIKSHL